MSWQWSRNRSLCKFAFFQPVVALAAGVPELKTGNHKSHEKHEREDRKACV